MDKILATLSHAAITTAATQVGVCENPKGSNGGPMVDQYLKSVGLSNGYAWCMAFVYWCVSKAAAELSLKNPLVKTAGVLLQYHTTKCRTIPNRSSAVKPGDIFIMEFSGGRGHTGFVEKVGKGVIYTIEGNTNDDGSREGYEVARRTRAISSIKGFIQL